MPKPKKPSIFDGLDEIIDTFLGIDETWISGRSSLRYEHKETLLQLCKGVGQQNVNCRKLIDTLFVQVNQTWDTLAPNYTPRPPSPENWRRRENRYVDPDRNLVIRQLRQAHKATGGTLRTAHDSPVR